MNINKYTPAPRGGELHLSTCAVCGARACAPPLCLVCHYWHEELERRGGDVGGSEYMLRALRRVAFFVTGAEIGPDTVIEARERIAKEVGR